MKLRGIAPIVAAIILAVVAGIGVSGSDRFLTSIETKYVVNFFVFASDKLQVRVNMNVSEADIFVLIKDGEGYSVVYNVYDYKNGTLFEINYFREFYVLAWRNGYVDAIVVNVTNIKPGEVWYHYKHYDRPSELAKYVRAKKRWWDILWEGLSILFEMLTGLRFVVDLVSAMLPYAGAVWTLWMFSAFMKALKELSIEPIVDFFYKNYQIVRGIVSAVTQIVLKIIDLITGPAT